ncbi:unnamed protein product [Caenorhabditis auriculariae]|uniref:Class II aldolase/adducin N-terminal domain-containing protein n=1 Tax=Caenorhabditis auriculariae TaxID=2777116 RepID=A0A8S1HZ56_9PELO|nr:unnamed protein product [Caenorhabditis auriculariae]
MSSMPNLGYTCKKPIDDVTDPKMNPEERRQRNKLASFYRLADIFKWSQGVFNHITVRVPNTQDEILINPFGLLYAEMTAASLVKVNLEGKVLDNGSTKYGLNSAGYNLHAAVHAARPDAICVVHLHTPAVAAVSAMECGLQPICQESMIVGPVAYHDYHGIVNEEAEKESLVADLGDKNVMILRNHGFVVCGRTCEEALHYTFHLILACETQVRCMANGNLDKIRLPSKEAVEKAYKVTCQGGGGVNRCNSQVEMYNWEIGELEWQAWMRGMDAMGMCTGHEYV